jgi:hypothetical protein
MPDLTRLLRGRVVADVWTNGTALQVRTKDGTEMTVGWVDDNGVPIKGKPVILQHGYRLTAQTGEMFFVPHIGGRNPGRAHP